MKRTLGAPRRSTALTAAGVLLMSMLAGVIGVVGSTTVAAHGAGRPSSPTDATKVPHYFGPWPNWANSPLTTSTAQVEIVDTGTGQGAAAVAQVDPASGAVSAIDVTAPGHGYDPATTTVTVTGGTADAAGTITVATGGAVVGLTVDAPGSGYTELRAEVTGGGGTGAAVSPSGGVDAVHLTDGGSGYTMPTVDFDLPDDPEGTIAKAHVPPDGLTPDGVVTTVVLDDPGSGYSHAPNVVIRNGTLADPINGATEATATTTLQLVGMSITNPGADYTSAPDVTITDPAGAGTGAQVTARTDLGAIRSIALTEPGAGFLTKGMKKFQDELPLPCDPGADGTGCPRVEMTTEPATGAASKFLPLAVPEAKEYSGEPADEYVIGLVQYRTKFSSDLPPTLVRGYVQLSTQAVPGQQIPLFNELLDGTKVPIEGYTGVTSPQWLGPVISAEKDRPVRIVFRNLLPNGAAGDLFLPTDSTGMGSGMGPMPMAAPEDQSSVMDDVRNPLCTASDPKSDMCFKDNRATLHLHGGTTPWISDGTPHQWITPAGEGTPWPQGVSVRNVPDMTEAGAEVCAADDDGCSTFYYTNQQSARMMFYHDHAWGITRLNVYAGEAAGYTITDAVEKKLVSEGTIPGAAETLPLIVQDRTFVPGDEQLKDTVVDGTVTTYGQDPTWDSAKWGTKGSFWYHHVYMPAQNPGDPSGMSAYGRWMYGPWFWPPASTINHGPIDNPYYDPACDLDDPTTWQYDTDPFCEPKQIPGTPNISMGMEQFNDTPIVNGVAYPATTVQPKAYRLRVLNAANDRFFNFQWYAADPTQGDGTTEVALKPGELAAAQTDPVVSPTPVDANNDAAGPDWIQIANEGGFLPAPAVIDGQQPTTWITDPTRFDVGNVDQHSLLLAPAERADVIVDFSRFAGKTLILYNDAPAAFPARVPSYDYYTGAPDLSPVGAPSVLPGYGPNTRTVMRVTVADTAPAPAFDLAKLRSAFSHKANGSGVFEAGQHPVIVGQAGYNSAYGTSFASSSNCNAANTTLQRCDGLVRVNNTGQLGVNTLRSPSTKTVLKMEPKAIHDEMNSTTFDEFGRMQATLGIEKQPPTPGLQNVTLYPYVNPATELIDGTKLPSADVKVTPLSDPGDGTQIWRFTHNGVDTHPIHFHLYDVQVLNRVTWDNIVKPPDPNELGWKDTVRMSPLEDTIVALRPVIPTTPFEIPNSVRRLNPMMPAGDTSAFNNIDVDGNPLATPIANRLVNFGWEYVFHCHILSHEEMDMMRPVSLALPPLKAEGLRSTITGNGTNRRINVFWTDSSITETGWLVQRTADGTTWVDAGTLPVPLDQPNTKGDEISFTDDTANASTPYRYRVQALNTVGYGDGMPQLTAQSVSATLPVNAPAAPSQLTGTVQAGPTRVALSWRDNSVNEARFLVLRSSDGGATFTQVGTAPSRNSSGGTVTFTDTGVSQGTTYVYKVAAENLAGATESTPVTVLVDVPPAPAISSATAARAGANQRITVQWADVLGESGYTVQWSTSSAFTTVSSANVAANATTFTTGNITRTTWYVRIRANNALGSSAWSPPVTVPPAP